MLLRKLLLSAVTLGALSVLPAMAEDGVPANAGPGNGGAPASGMEPKNSADTDGDGFLSRAEFQVVQDKRFAEMDKDSDGKVSREEMKTYREAKRAEFKEKRAEWKAKRDAAKGDQGGDGEEPPVE